MHIILTHEQTDFDALASLLGAYIINDNAIPVLPRRINRNVRSFLILYGVELPFVDPRDLGGQTIESVCLVDTQSLVSVKGMGKHTRVRVIDHHALREDTPADWEITTDETGANATLFVEAVQKRKIPISIVQATLLLLGIYEDTGSLTYTRTTPRDVRAAAYLLERGASLSIANDFLNHPLSLDQQAIYDQLRQEAEHLDIHGHAIIVACGDDRGMDEELSSIAHKIRDVLDPDALILLISIHGGVQLIARSTSDNINVSKIAAHFGGGGHPRAAAALIKNRPIEAIHTELLEILPGHVQAPITVAEIMSRAPQVLSPDTSVQEASRRMKRYGYEGYPVVENEEIIGLLTRRAVDRAISHKLNLKASSLMKAGKAHVHPDHSVEYLQNIMTDTGWGQIPVVERDSHKIIGIVTRTDLLKTLAPKTPLPGHQNLADKLKHALPPARLNLLQTIAKIAEQQHVALYIVGGFVRDLLLEHPSLDFDLVIEGDAIALAHAVEAKYGGRITTHKRFGTAKWFLGDSSLQNADQLPEALDFITARTEFYTHPTALPTVERGSIKLDLHRRDFTINTLALRLDGRHYGELHDDWGGLNDLQKGIIRVLHSLSFVDDPTRMLRAVRYEQRYNFSISDRTLELLTEAHPLLDRVSGDRIRHELDNIIAEENAPQMLHRLHELDILATIHPNLIWDKWIQNKLANLQSTTPRPKTPPTYWRLKPKLRGARLKRALAYTLWLIRLPIDQAQDIIDKLKLSRTLEKSILAACPLWTELPVLIEKKPSVITARLERIPAFTVYALYQATDNPAARLMLQTYAKEWKNLSARITGHDLRARGISPGPIYKEILGQLRNAWLDGDISTNEQEEQLLEELIEEAVN
ncbi:MAG: CBS domain-containing protein [Chloroflexota bacterium]|nr:CBS domain-containing protein [Chloroflexota bacterium]